MERDAHKDRSPAAFHAVLDSLVKQNPIAGASLRGRIFIGTRGEAGDVWWMADLGARVRSRIVPAPSPDADAVLLLGERDAEAILSSGRLPRRPSLAQIEGDSDLLLRFIDRCLTVTSPSKSVDPRVPAPIARRTSGARRAKSRSRAQQRRKPKV